MLEYRLGEVEVTREYDPKLSRITSYGGGLNQVWTQLLENALDAVAEDGHEGHGHILLRTTCPKELQARVFEPFYTTKGVGAGVGLGLDLSYRIIVGRHGGDIRVVSEPGDTRFQVRLPLVAGDGADK